MKIRTKITKIISVVVCLFAVLALTACAEYGAPEYDTSAPRYAIEPQKFEQKLASFMENCGADRTSYSEKEEAAALYLAGELGSYGLDAGVTDKFEIAINDKVTVTTQHVIARYGSGGRKNVMIATNYDNVYDSPYNGENGTKSNGVLSNGTGVAAILAIAEYLGENKPELGYDVTFVLFGGSTLDTKSSSKYLNTVMTEDERGNTVLMIEFQRLGVDHVYAFSDERETRREAVFDRVAKENSLEIYKTTTKSAAMPLEAINGVPYYTWVMSGHSRNYFNQGIPTLNLVGANYETIDLTDTESASHGNIENTELDTLENLVKLYPDYADKVATAATLVINSLLDPEFLSAVEYDKNNFPNTNVLTKSWIWYLVALGFIIICYGIVTFVKVKLTKKYPIVAPQPKKIKMAVFGMDYEDKDADSIYIDLKQAPANREEIFPGIPNNDMPSPVPPQFPAPPVFDDLLNSEVKSDNKNNSDTEFNDPFAREEKVVQERISEEDESVVVEEAPEKPKADDVPEKSEAPERADEKQEKTEVAKKTRKNTGTSGSGSGTSAPRKSTARKTTSAPKSANAKKSTDEDKKDNKTHNSESDGID